MMRKFFDPKNLLAQITTIYGTQAVPRFGVTPANNPATVIRGRFEPLDSLTLRPRGDKPVYPQPRRDR